MSKRWIAVSLSSGLLFVAALVLAQSPPSRTIQEAQAPQQVDDMQLFMRAKLANSQKVMEGLVTENFELIEEAAKQLKKISEASHWPSTIDEVYQHHSVAFRVQCGKLADQAARKDLQAAHYTYLHMSTTCIDCHNYVRGRFRVERKNPGGPIQLIPTDWDGSSNKDLPAPEPDDEETETNALLLR